MHQATASLALPGLVLLTGLAHADADEWRVAAAGAGMVTKIRAAGVDGDGLGFGGRARLGYGVTNSLELAVEGSFTRTQAIRFDGASIDGQEGDLFADTTTAELAVGVRWSFGVEVWRALERLHPFLGVRGGGLLRNLSGQVLLNSQDMVLVEPGDDLTIAPFVAGTAGLERRFGDHFFVAVAFDVGFGKAYQHLGASLELAWSWY